MQNFRHLGMVILLAIVVLVVDMVMWWGFTNTVQAQSAGLEEVRDIVSSDVPQTTNVSHSISFTLPHNALSIDTTDYIHITLPHFTDVTTATNVVGVYAGTPVFSLDGNTIKITGIFVLPGKNITIGGITASNPNSVSLYNVLVSVTLDEAGNLIKNYGTTNATTSKGTVAVTANIEYPLAAIHITGYSAPSTFVTFVDGQSVIGTDLTSGIGVFSKIFSGLEPGDYNINLYGVDLNNRVTSIVPLNITAPVYQTTLVSNILLSPTVEINKAEYEQSEPIYATGSAYPGTTITIFTDTPTRTYSASASATGDWTYTITDTSDYAPGDYRLYTLAQTQSALQSLTSRISIFTIVGDSSGGTGTPCGDISRGDLNCDGNINLTDFSILMYYWASSDFTSDINQDGQVNLTDFSIMMYYWGS